MLGASPHRRGGGTPIRRHAHDRAAAGGCALGHNMTVRATILLGAIVGLLLGLGLGLSSNVSGVVLGFYGLGLGVVVAAVASSRRSRS